MIGDTVLHYNVISELGQGGMGVVYKAEDKRLRRIVALKFLPMQRESSEEDRSRLVLEAQAAAGLNHPNICVIHSVEEFGGEQFIVMEYVDGITLRKRISEGALPVPKAVDYCIQIAEALQEAHSRGIIHRDIKADNIMITPSGRVKVMDFGLAKLKGTATDSKPGGAAGTLVYMSPEQARGDDVDAPSDIWSLGVLLYEMLTGRLPFSHDYEAAVVYSLLNEPPAPPREIRDEISPELERIVLKCLQKESVERYASAEQLAKDLRRVTQSDAAAGSRPFIADRKTEPRKATERKPATILLLRLPGYSDATATEETEEVYSFMERVRAIVEKAASKYDGTVSKISAGEVLVLFGLPEAIERPAEKAVRAAMEMRTALQELGRNENTLRHFNPAIAVDTGLVIAGELGPTGKSDYAVVGDPMDLTEKIVRTLEKGSIVVGPLTHKQTKEYFDYKQGPAVGLKNNKQQVPCFELAGLRGKSTRSAASAERRISSALVGRDREMNLLELHLLKAINGEGSIVNVVAEPGLGKSRLIAELKQREAMKRVLLLEGRAVSYGRNMSFHPIIEILRQWSGIEEEDTEQKAMDKLGRAIGNVISDGVDEILPFVASVMGMELTGKQADLVSGIAGDALMKITQKNIRELMLKESLQKPIVYILEDLHWADQSSLELLQSLYRLAQNSHIMFLNVMRPNYPETSDRLLEAMHSKYPELVTDLILEPLDSHNCRELINNLVDTGKLPAQTTETILNRADGNPFFIEEVIRSFLDEGAIELRDGEFNLTDRINDVIIPDSVQQILMARIDRLDEETKSLLKIASVIGRGFFQKILTDVAGSVDEIDERLEYLEDVQLIRKNRKLDEIEYQFKHALVQEVAYESIPSKKRKEYHLDVAQAIERVFADRLHEFYGTLAMHYSEADEQEKTEDYLIKAGEATLRSAASHEALTYFKEALRLYLKKYGASADPQKIAALEQNIGTALYNKGMLVEAVAHFDRALELLGDRDPRSRFVLMLRGVRDFFWIVKDLYRPSRRKKKNPTENDRLRFAIRYQRANALGNSDTFRLFFDLLWTIHWRSGFNLSPSEACLMYTLGCSLMIFGGISASLAGRFLDRAAAVAVPDDPRTYLAYKYAWYQFNYHVGKWDIDLDFDEELFRTGMKLGEFYPACYYIAFAHYISVGRGDFATSARLADILLRTAEEYDYEYALLDHYTALVYHHCNRHEAAEMLKAAIISLELEKKIGLKTWMVGGEGIIARAHILAGDFKPAEEALRRSERYLEPLGKISPMFTMNLYIGRLHLGVIRFEQLMSENGRKSANNELGEARKQAHRSSKLVIGQFKTLHEFMPEGHRYTGTLNWLEGNTAGAFRHWKKSVDAASAMRKKQELGRTYLEIGRRLLEKRGHHRLFEGLDAIECLKKARGIFEEMDLASDLVAVERLHNSELRSTEYPVMQKVI